MSKNIVIQEGGIGRQFTAQKLVTPLIEGGSCNWIPEDEVQLGTKYISENGTYIAANDGEYGYSQVNVNVNTPTKIITGSTDDGEPVVTTVDVIDGNISEIILGDYFIVTYDDDEVAKIEDNNGNRCLLTYDGETLTGFDDVEDNHYTIILDSNGNISQVIDPNAQECELRDSDGDGKIDIISIGTVMRVIPDVETGDIKIIDENDNDVTDDFVGTSITGVDSDDTPWRANIVSDVDTGGASVGITPVTPATTPGASITGIDATTGNEAVATVDENGNIEVISIPSSIRVETSPTKTEYNDGDVIDYNGIVVKAYTNDGVLWTDVGHPNGIIPQSELYCTEKKADYKKAKHGKGTRTLDGESVDVSTQWSFEHYENISGKLLSQGTNVCPDGVLFIPSNRFRWLAVSDMDDVSIHYTVKNQNNQEEQGEKALTYVVGESGITGNNIYGATPIGWDRRNDSVYTLKTSPDLELTPGINDLRMADIALHGTGSIGQCVQTIPISWARIGDNQLLESSFDIHVLEPEGGGGGGGDDSPVPEGVTVQDLNIAIYNAMNAGLDYIEIDGEQYTIAEAQDMIDYLISH